MAAPMNTNKCRRLPSLAEPGKKVLAWLYAGPGGLSNHLARLVEKAVATAVELNRKLGNGTIQGMQNGEAASKADICVLTVVYTAHQEAIAGLRSDLQGKILVDTTARVDFLDPRPPASPAAARMAQDKLGPGVRVVAAFQNVPASVLKKNLDHRWMSMCWYAPTTCRRQRK
jgi:predicted dinucleotide-binding enzyme